MKNRARPLSNRNSSINLCNFLIRSIHYPKYLSYLITDIKLYNNFLLNSFEMKRKERYKVILFNSSLTPCEAEIKRYCQERERKILEFLCLFLENKRPIVSHSIISLLKKQDISMIFIPYVRKIACFYHA